MSNSLLIIHYYVGKILYTLTKSQGACANTSPRSEKFGTRGKLSVTPGLREKYVFANILFYVHTPTARDMCLCKRWHFYDESLQSQSARVDGVTTRRHSGVWVGDARCRAPGQTLSQT